MRRRDTVLSGPSRDNNGSEVHRPEHSEGTPSQSALPLSEFDDEPEPDPDADPMNDPFYAKTFGGEG